METYQGKHRAHESYVAREYREVSADNMEWLLEPSRPLYLIVRHRATELVEPWLSRWTNRLRLRLATIAFVGVMVHA